MENNLKETDVSLNQQEKKLKKYFETNKPLFDSWNGNFEEFLKSTRQKYETIYQREFKDFSTFIDYLIGDVEEAGNGTSLSRVDHPPKINSLKDELDRLFKIWIDQATCWGGINEEDEADQEWLYYLECKAITDFYNTLTTYREHIEKTCLRQLGGKKLQYAPQWMIEDPAIEPLIQKYKICEILNELEKKDSRSVKTKKPFRYLFQLDEPKYHGRYPYACFITNQSFYQSILPELDIQKITLQKYFKALCDVGAIKKLDGAGRVDVRKNETLYALGYLSDFKGTNNKLNRFMTQKNKKNLAKFKLS